MGGVLARLLVSDSGNVILDKLEEKYPQAARRIDQIDSKYSQIVKFKALQGVTEAIFLAAPHRGTPYADASWAKYLASFVKLPLSIVNTLGEMTLTIFGREPPREISLTGVDNLSAKDPTIRTLASIPISPEVKYYSIIARADPEMELTKSSDGIVPYWSAHLDGARSEKIITSGHSVQETPEAIIEIRKILRNELKNASMIPTQGSKYWRDSSIEFCGPKQSHSANFIGVTTHDRSFDNHNSSVKTDQKASLKVSLKEGFSKA